MNSILHRPDILLKKKNNNLFTIRTLQDGYVLLNFYF